MKPFPPSLRFLAPSLFLALLLAGCFGVPKPHFSTSDQTDLDRVENYLDGTKQFEAHFTQTGDFGPGAGIVWLDRPGNLRIDYEGPASRVMVIANGRVRILDRGNGATTTMPVSKTPLGILLAPNVSLSGAVTVTHIGHAEDALQITLTKTDAPTQGSLTLYLSDHPLHLNAVTLTDPYNRNLTLSLSGFDLHPALTPDLFKPPAASSGS